MTQNRIFHAGDSPMAAVYNEAALRSHLEGLFAVGAIAGVSSCLKPDAVEGAITKLVANPYKLFRFGLLTVEFRPDQQAAPDSISGSIAQAIAAATVEAMLAPYTHIEQAYIDAARERFHKDGELELDDGAVVSLSDDAGAYVQMWKWVPASLVSLPETEGEDDDAQE